jgi:hypothetical protein
MFYGIDDGLDCNGERFVVFLCGDFCNEIVNGWDEVLHGIMKGLISNTLRT